MGDGILETLVDWAIAIGIGLFLWSVAHSLGAIAQALTKLAASRGSLSGTSQSGA